MKDYENIDPSEVYTSKDLSLITGIKHSIIKKMINHMDNNDDIKMKNSGYKVSDNTVIAVLNFTALQELRSEAIHFVQSVDGDAKTKENLLERLHQDGWFHDDPTLQAEVERFIIPNKVH